MLFLKGGIALSQQLKLFEQYIEKLKEMVGEERTTFIIKNSLFMVICGSNDITNTYFALPSVQHQYDVASFTTLMADNARSFAQVRMDIINKPSSYFFSKLSNFNAHVFFVKVYY